MAIEKEIITSTGYPAKYWKIVRIDIGWRGSTDVFLHCYKDKDTSDAGGEPLYYRGYTYPSSEFVGSLDTRETAYNLVKLEDALAGGIDV